MTVPDHPPLLDHAPLLDSALGQWRCAACGLPHDTGRIWVRCPITGRSLLELGPALEPPTVGGRFRMDDLLGVGSTSAVYAARDLLVGRDVAVKVLRSAAESPEWRRFEREAQALNGLTHPNVVELLATGTTDGGQPYVALERLVGKSLERHLAEERRMALPAAASMLEQLLSALCAVHAVGVVHRDISPSNVFLVEGRAQAKLLDFGFGRFVDGGSATTGDVLGSPWYLAPEQLLANAPDRPADVYGLGAVLYEAITGGPPFDLPAGATVAAAVRLVLAHEPRRPSQLREGLPPAVEAFLLRAIARDRADRFRDAEEMREAAGPALAAMRAGCASPGSAAH